MAVPASLRRLQQAAGLGETPEQARARLANGPFEGYEDTGTGYDPIFMDRPENKNRPSSMSTAALSGRTVYGGGSGIATGSPEWFALRDRAAADDAGFAARAQRAKQLNVNGTLIDPASDAAGYFRLLGESMDARRHREADASDAANAGNVRLTADNAWQRAVGEFNVGRGGYAHDLSAALFEAPQVIAENLGKTAKVNYKTLDLPNAPMAGLPPGYTEDRYRQELDDFVRGGPAPAFTASDTRGFPEVQQRFQREIAQRQRASQGQARSLAALAKQGGL